jgi:hypothetical protein
MMNTKYAKLTQSLSDALRSKKDNTLLSYDLRGLVVTSDSSKVVCAYTEAKLSA